MSAETAATEAQTTVRASAASNTDATDLMQRPIATPRTRSVIQQSSLRLGQPEIEQMPIANPGVDVGQDRRMQERRPFHGDTYDSW
ncbi:MAG: hypothetical protein DYH17_14005 [Xanthomonadales bacterium PRO6]|nr:hypothetical protein [Xanthomonadales bacterium PRO6]